MATILLSIGKPLRFYLTEFIGEPETVVTSLSFGLLGSGG